MCANEIALVNDYFIADFDSNETITYSSIDNIERTQTKIYVQHNNLGTVLEFETEKDSLNFFDVLQKKVQR